MVINVRNAAMRMNIITDNAYKHMISDNAHKKLKSNKVLYY